MSTTVRSGAEVVLSGKESQKGEDDAGEPLIEFDWEQVGPAGTPVQLVRRTSNTVSFVAPQVKQDTTLLFRLTVADVHGLSDSTEARVVVKPIRDQDHFLQYLGVARTFPVVVASQTPIAASPSADATAQVPVTVTLTKLATFVDRGGISHVRVPVGTPTTVTTGWSTRLGSAVSCAGNENPVVQLPIPHLDLDDALTGSIAGFPAAEVLSDVVELSDVGDAILEVRVDGVSPAAIPLLCVNGGAAAPSGVVVAAEDLLANATPRDSAVAAEAYYDTIDPTGAKSTLSDWLTVNGFDPAVKGWGAGGADAHAIYTNNYDLGFGRDMYMKFGACDSGAASLPLQDRIGKCDVAAVVVNYADVEAAAKSLNPIVAVAMEYNAQPVGAERFVKFYTFAPDTRTGEFARVNSVNLDRRGEQYMPQACVVCHGGTPGTVDPQTGAYSNGGNIDSGFLSWDLDSFLYSDTDPGFSRKPRDATFRGQFTRALQEAQFKTLNTGAYLTMADPAGRAGRFALGRELLEGWYGGVGLPRASFDGAFVPPGWQPNGVDGVSGTADDNPTDAATIYKDAFASNCRACHVLHVPQPNVDPRTAVLTAQGAQTPIAACTGDDRLMNTRVGEAFQVPIGCYWQLVHSPNIADRLSRNQMPFARRTSDRIWVDTGARSAGELLQAHLRDVQGLDVATPGTPDACIDAFGVETQDQGATKFAVGRGEWLNLGASCSRFLDGARWSLAAPGGSDAVLVGADTANPRFLPDVQGDYALTLTDATGATTADAVATVPVVAPVAGSDTRTIVLDAGGSGSVDVDVTTLAGFQSRDALAALTVNTQSSVTATPLSASVLRIATSSVAGGSVTYRLTDVDGDSSGLGTITIQASATIAANDQTFTQTTNVVGFGINLASFVSRPAGQAFTLTVTQPTTQGSRGRGSVSAPNGAGQVTYNAPKGVTSHFGGSLIDAGSVDQFTYTACFTLQPAVCDTGTIRVQLQGTQSFLSVQTELVNSCRSCHGGTQTGANTAYIIAASYPSSADRHALYCLARSLTSVTGSTGTEPAGTAYVNEAAPSQSLLYRKPNGELGHNGGTVGTPSVFLNWIDQGAYFTESTQQSCP